MTISSSITKRLLNFFTFAQKFIAICVLFAVTIGSLAFLLVQRQLSQLEMIDIELEGIRYDRPLMQLLQYLIQHQQASQRIQEGDKSLEGVLDHLEQRVSEALVQLVNRNSELEEKLLGMDGPLIIKNHTLSPEAIRQSWETLIQNEHHFSTQQSLEAHVNIIEQLRNLAAFLKDSTTLQPETDLPSHYLTTILYTETPLLQQWLLSLASLGETVAAELIPNRSQYQELVAAMALVQQSKQEIEELTGKAVKARRLNNGDLSLKAATEGPLSELSSAISMMFEYIKTNLLNEDHGQASSGTYLVTATRALNESFQFANAVSEQLERLLIQRKETMQINAQLIGIAVLFGIILAFLFSFILFRAMFLPLKNLVIAAEQLAKGHLSVRVPILQSDEIAEVGRAFNHMANAMEEILSQLQSAGVQLTTSTTQMAAAAKEQEATIVQQETATKQIAITAKEISLTASEFASTIQDVTHSAEEASLMATTGKDALHQMKDIMQNMVNASTDIASQLATLNDKTNTITGVITTITKVADRTNLLSLNAAIEAHKIGDKGGGFSVIAAEIRRLADQTAYATLDIEKVVNEMVSAVSSSVEGMVRFSNDIRQGVEKATSISGLLTNIIAQVQQQTSTFEMVNQGMEAQSVGAKQITDSIEDLSSVAQLSSSSIRQFHNALNQLSSAIKELQSTVSRLQVQGRNDTIKTT